MNAFNQPEALGWPRGESARTQNGNRCCVQMRARCRSSEAFPASRSAGFSECADFWLRLQKLGLARFDFAPLSLTAARVELF